MTNYCGRLLTSIESGRLVSGPVSLVNYFPSVAYWETAPQARNTFIILTVCTDNSLSLLKFASRFGPLHSATAVGYSHEIFRCRD